MKKQIITTLIIILISLSKSQNNNIDRFINECIEAGNTGGNIEKTQCTSISMDYDLKCCYVQYTYNDEEEDKDVEVKKCRAIKDNLEDIIDYHSGIKLYSNNKVLCYSNFISIKHILLLFILFNFIFV